MGECRREGKQGNGETMAPSIDTNEQLLQIYEQQIENLDYPDEPSNELLLVLTTRDEFEDRVLSEEQQQRLDQLDDELVKRWEILAQWLPNPGGG